MGLHASSNEGCNYRRCAASSLTVARSNPALAGVVKQPGDGSCLFHSLAHGMRGAGRGSPTADADGVRGTGMQPWTELGTSEPLLLPLLLLPLPLLLLLLQLLTSRV